MRIPAPVPNEGSRDPGLQSERTDLAWRRTLLSLVVADLFILRSWTTSLPQPGDHAFTTLGLSVAAAAIASVLLGTCFVLRSRSLQHQPATAPAALITRTAAGAVIVLAIATAASIILPT